MKTKYELDLLSLLTLSALALLLEARFAIGSSFAANCKLQANKQTQNTQTSGKQSQRNTIAGKSKAAAKVEGALISAKLRKFTQFECETKTIQKF